MRRQTVPALLASLALAALTACTTPAALAAPRTFTFTPGSGGTKVIFASKAPMESFEGSTTAITGRIVLDPDALGDSVGVEVAVDLRTLDTGIDLRNQHMRENHLHTERFPLVVFRGASLIGAHPARLTPGEKSTIEVAGTFDLHGVARRLTAPVELEWDPATSELRIEARFVVTLADHEIPRPKMLFMKLDEKQSITFRAVARPE